MIAKNRHAYRMDMVGVIGSQRNKYIAEKGVEPSYILMKQETFCEIMACPEQNSKIYYAPHDKDTPRMFGMIIVFDKHNLLSSPSSMIMYHKATPFG